MGRVVRETVSSAVTAGGRRNRIWGSTITVLPQIRPSPVRARRPVVMLLPDPAPRPTAPHLGMDPRSRRRLEQNTRPVQRQRPARTAHLPSGPRRRPRSICRYRVDTRSFMCTGLVAGQARGHRGGRLVTGLGGAGVLGRQPADHSSTTKQSRSDGSQGQDCGDAFTRHPQGR
jgi:hypothetical protein